MSHNETINFMASCSLRKSYNLFYDNLQYVTEVHSVKLLSWDQSEDTVNRAI